MTILIAGDFSPLGRVADFFEANDFDYVLKEVKPIIEQTDYSIVNFESSVTKGGEKPILKQGPNLQCSEKGVEAIRWAGFQCVTLANNHFLDYGGDAVRNTLDICRKYEIDTVGGGMNLSEASKILYKELKGKTLAIINCCEHEFSVATGATPGCNPLNPIQQYYSIQEARKKADYVLVIVHGGHEMWQLPSPRMVETYRFFVDAGADTVVNHHQHCFSGYENYKGKPIFYGLGNFCFDRKGSMEELWDYGYMVNIHFSNQISFEVLPYEQCKDEPKIKLLKDKQRIEEQLQELNDIISDGNKLAQATLDYYQRSSRATNMVLEPYSGKMLSKLFLKGMLPRLMNRGKLIKMLNMVECEAHRDKLLFFLKRYYNDRVS